MAKSLKQMLLGTAKERETAIRKMFHTLNRKRSKQKAEKLQQKRNRVKRTLRKHHA